MELGAREADLLTRLAANGHTVFSVDKAKAYWTGAGTIGNVLSRLVRKGWLFRLARGVYMLVPLEAGPERTWSESALVMAAQLIQPSAVAYWSALHYWGMTEQVPQVTFVQSTRRKRALAVLGMQFRFITVSPAHFFGVVQRSLDARKLYVTDREKTLIDAADRPDLSGGIGQLAQALQAAHSDVDWARLDDYLVRWGGGAVVKRLGYLIDSLKLPVPERATRLAHWQTMLSKGISWLEPGIDASGPVVTHWRLKVNVAVGDAGRTVA